MSSDANIHTLSVRPRHWRVLLGMYGMLWRLCRPFLRRNKRLAEGFEQHLVPHRWTEPVDSWMQAASGGEAYLVWEVLRATPSSCTTRLLITSCTRQGFDVLQKAATWTATHRPHITMTVRYFPFDEPTCMRKALAQGRPQQLVLFETELWPNLLAACADASIPITIINGRMSPQSFAAYQFLKGLWKLFPIQRVAAISTDDASRFALLLPQASVEVMPNIKFDKAAREIASQGQSHAIPTEQKQKNTTQPSGNEVDDKVDKQNAPLRMLLPQHVGIAVFGSVREEEEPLVLTAVQQLHQHMQLQGDATTIVIAPRHMHRIRAWKKLLNQAEIPVAQRSHLTPDQPAPRSSVVLWDTFGELNALYAMAHAVFVGGSLVPLGGQNILEPLAQGIVPCSGQYLDNFLWLEPHELVADGLLSIATTPEDVASSLALTLQKRHEHNTNAVQTRLMDWLARRQGGSLQAATLLNLSETTNA